MGGVLKPRAGWECFLGGAFTLRLEECVGTSSSEKWPSREGIAGRNLAAEQPGTPTGNAGGAG